MRYGIFKQVPFWIAVTVITLVGVAQMTHHESLERLEHITYDWRVRQAVGRYPEVSTNLGFVDISESTITLINSGQLGFQFGLYWPRQIYGRVVRELRAEGAKAVGFDIMFAGLRPDHPKITLSDFSEIDSDSYFAQQLHNAGNVILASDHSVVPNKLFRTNSVAIGDITTDRDPDGILRRTPAFQLYRKWHPAFEKLKENTDFLVDLDAARIEGNQLLLPRPEPNAPIVVPLDKEGRFDLTKITQVKLTPNEPRFFPPFTMERVWNMGITLAAQQLKIDLDRAEVDLKHGRIRLKGENNVERVIPVDRRGFFYINWTISTNDTRLAKESFEALLSRDSDRQSGRTNLPAFEITKKNWANKLVMVGSTATGNDLTDLGATPLEKQTPLVSEHWNVANSVLTNRFVRRSSSVMDVFIIFVLGSFAAFSTWFFRPHIALAWVLVVLAAYIGAANFLYSHFLYWIPMVLPLAGGMLTTQFCMFGYLVLFTQAERRQLRSLFVKMVPPDVVTELMKSEKLPLEGSLKIVTVFFSDIRGFTEMTDVNRDNVEHLIKQHNLSEKAAEEVRNLQARETLATVNLYLKVIADIVLKHGGTVDKFIGDCVMAFWGAPVANPRHALSSVQAAVEMQRAIYHLNLSREAENRRREEQNIQLAREGGLPLSLLPILVVGTGINTGIVTVGLMGSDERLNYTVFGREVNLASRLESVSGRARIIISEATLAEMIQDDPTFAQTCIALPPEKVKGIREAVRMYEVPWRQDLPVNPLSAGAPPTMQFTPAA